MRKDPWLLPTCGGYVGQRNVMGPVGAGLVDLPAADLEFGVRFQPCLHRGVNWGPGVVLEVGGL